MRQCPGDLAQVRTLSEAAGTGDLDQRILAFPDFQLRAPESDLFFPPARGRSSLCLTGPDSKVVPAEDKDFGSPITLPVDLQQLGSEPAT